MERTKVYKKCHKCNIITPLQDFNTNKSNKDGYTGICKSCKKQYNEDNKDYQVQQHKEYYKRHKKEKQEYCLHYYRTHKKNYLQKRYNITEEEYEKQFNKQKGCCAICGKSQSELKNDLCVDHNHKNGQNRELLCKLCNMGLGSFKDDISLLNKAILYLNKHKE